MFLLIASIRMLTTSGSHFQDAQCIGKFPLISSWTTHMLLPSSWCSGLPDGRILCSLWMTCSLGRASAAPKVSREHHVRVIFPQGYHDWESRTLPKSQCIKSLTCKLYNLRCVLCIPLALLRSFHSIVHFESRIVHLICLLENSHAARVQIVFSEAFEHTERTEIGLQVQMISL